MRSGPVPEFIHNDLDGSTDTIKKDIDTAMKCGVRGEIMGSSMINRVLTRLVII